MPVETHAVNLLLLKMVEHLTAQMQTNIPDDDVTRADVVKMGLLTDNKTKKNVQLGVSAGDRDFPEDMDGIITLEKLPNIGLVFPAREIGGGEIWMRRGVVRVESFFVRERLTEEAATAQAYRVLGRLEAAIDTVPVATIPRDSFGERILSIHCYATSYFESGGPPSSYIFRGKAYWAAIVEKKPNK